MNKRRQEKSKMLTAVTNFGTTNAKILATIPGIPASMQVLQTSNDAVNTYFVKQTINTSGGTVKKKKLEETLINDCIQLKVKLHYIAVTTGNTDLETVVDVTDSEIKNATDLKLVAICRIMKDSATANLTALAPFGVTAAILTTFQNNTNTYANFVAQSTTVQGSDDSTNFSLAALESTIDTTLKSLDLGMRILSFSQPALHQEYLRARAIKRLPTNKRAATATVTDSQTGEGIPNVKMTIIPAGNLQKSITTLAKNVATKKSSKKGSSIYQNLPEGEYTITASKAGYKDITTTITIIAGETLKLAIKMDKTDTSAIMIG